MVVNVDGNLSRRLAHVHHRIQDVVAEQNMGSPWRLTFNSDPLERDYTFSSYANVLDAESPAYKANYPTSPWTPQQRFAIRAIPGRYTCKYDHPIVYFYGLLTLSRLRESLCRRRYVILPQTHHGPRHAMNVTNVRGRHGRNVFHSPLPNIRSATPDQVWLIEPPQGNQFTFSAQHVIEASVDVEPEDYDQYRALVTTLQEGVSKLESVELDSESTS